MKGFKLLTLILSLLPSIIEAIKSVETAVPVAHSGQQKHDIVLDLLRLAYERSPEIRSQFQWDEFATAADGVIGSIVFAFNRSGIFKRTPTIGAGIALGA